MAHWYISLYCINNMTMPTSLKKKFNQSISCVSNQSINFVAVAVAVFGPAVCCSEPPTNGLAWPQRSQILYQRRQDSEDFTVVATQFF